MEGFGLYISHFHRFFIAYLDLHMQHVFAEQDVGYYAGRVSETNVCDTISLNPRDT
jgi:hypothetical protein